MIFGSNDVYEPVAAYDVGQYTRNGIISGGNGGNVTTTQGVTFTWVYDPNTPNASGFTGSGWHQDTEGSPIWYYETVVSPGTDIVQQIVEGQRSNLDDVFRSWQDYVNVQSFQGNDVLKQFQQVVWNCWSNISVS